jgi:hypothetical protein
MRCERMQGWETFSSQRAGPVADLVGGIERHPGSVENRLSMLNQAIVTMLLAGDGGAEGLKEAGQRRVAEGAVAEELVGRPADEDVR